MDNIVIKTNPENIQLRMDITLESLTRKLTAFCTFEELLDRGGHYVPTFDCTNPDCTRLADLYDQEQERRGDDRRAFRTGSVEIIASRRYKRFRKGRSPKMIAFSTVLCLFLSGCRDLSRNYVQDLEQISFALQSLLQLIALCVFGALCLYHLFRFFRAFQRDRRERKRLVSQVSEGTHSLQDSLEETLVKEPKMIEYKPKEDQK